MAARCRETSAPTVLPTTLSASMKRLPRCAVLVIICRLAVRPLTHHVRNEGPLKGAYIVLEFISSFQLCIKVCRKSRVTTGKNGGPPATGASSNRARLCIMLLIVSSYVPTPTSHQNWGRRLIGKPLFATPCHAPFRINPVRSLIDHRYNLGVASLLSLL
jgi:hypothetical protein